MDTEAQARRLRDVLQHLHLSAVIPDAVDAEPRAGCRDIGWNAVDQRILAALGTVDPFKTSPRVRTRKGAQMMRDRVEITVRPVRYPGESPAGCKIHSVGAATHLGRHQQHPVTEAPAADIGPGIDQLAFDIVALRFGVGVAGVPSTVRRYVLALDGIG